MITFEQPEDGELVIHCPFCGTHNHPDTVSAATCPHLVMVYSSESNEPDYDRDGVFKDYDEENDFFHDFVEKKFDDSYLRFRVFIPAPSGFEVCLIFDYN